jgi:signal transduction histidine kinase
MTVAERRVLLLLEHRANAALLENRLRADGATVVTAADVEPPLDLAVVDPVDWPAKSERLRALRASEHPAHLPTLVLASARQALGFGPGLWELADDVLVTPVRPPELDARMRHLLALRDASLEHARRVEQLSRSNTNLEQFAFVAAHELSGPLSVVTGTLRTIAARGREALDPDLNGLVDVALREAGRLETLVSDLLAFSQVDRRPDRRPVDLAELVRDAIESTRAATGVDETVFSVGELPVVRADARQLRFVFSNLLGNAVKYRVAGKALRVDISAEPLAEHWRITVADNGSGIDERVAANVFEMYDRGDSRGIDGHGIGLALCRRIIDRHGGGISVESTPGLGSVFRLTLPRV